MLPYPDVTQILKLDTQQHKMVKQTNKYKSGKPKIKKLTLKLKT